MAFTVEDGTGLTAANSYAAVAELVSYTGDRGVDISSADTQAREQALVNASQYLDQKYGPRWKGLRNSRDQGLDWPRYEVVDRNGFPLPSNEVPKEIVNATLELAIRKIQGTSLEPDVPAAQPVEGVTQVGPIRKYFRHFGRPSSPKFRTVEQILAPLLKPGGIELIRA
jgi:hypothetical protein